MPINNRHIVKKFTIHHHPRHHHHNNLIHHNNHMDRISIILPLKTTGVPLTEEGLTGGIQGLQMITNHYNSFLISFRFHVTEALARAGLESSNLIVGIDFTKSNEWTGAKSFNRRSLHHIGDGFNPYEQAISIIGKTLAAFDEDNLIPCFGFGDAFTHATANNKHFSLAASTHDQDVFSFYPDERFCNGFEEVLSQYREIVPNLRLAGPTSFAPVIEMAMTIVEKSGGQYHVLLIIADGQVTRSVDTEHGQLSPQEQKTVEAIVRASKLPLSIILVGVGDGPWDMMREFDDNIPDRDFDNFQKQWFLIYASSMVASLQFVNFTEIMSKNAATSRKETEFALSALMEIPSQYKATIELNLLGDASVFLSFELLCHLLFGSQSKGIVSERVPLPPPMYSAASFSSSKPSRPASFEPSVPSYQRDSQPFSSAPPATCSTYDNQQSQATLSADLTAKLTSSLLYRFALFASVIRRTWPLVVGIRHVATVEKPFSYVQSVEVRLKQE
uniref:VWFA domain-containing protein n=1 Tax=Salix viminalis TaxID=40686 RepID=A0A6N2MNG4_SALVM